MTSSTENGLGLFDDAASAVGNFPSALRGYDRAAVDDYVRSLEGALVSTRRRAAALEEQMRSVQDQLSESIEKQRAQEIDFTNLGARATEILRLAEEQAREVLDRAAEDAERTKETARREADQVRSEAVQAGTEIKASGIAEIENLRGRGQQDIQGQVERAREEAELITAAARREAEALQRSAEHEAQTVRQNAYLDTEKLRREVEHEVAEVRQGITAEREAAIGHLRGVHDETVARTAALLSEATEHHQRATSQLEHDIAEAARIRSEAVAEADQIKVAAAKEAEDRLVAARRQAAAITDRTQQEFAWRKQQLRRETDLLGQRKQAVLSQLASLSALAEQTAHSFPDLEDLDDFEGEQGDRTVMMPPATAPTLPRGADRPAVAATPDAGAQQKGKDSGGADQRSSDQGGSDQGGSDQRSSDRADDTTVAREVPAGDADESATETRVFQAVSNSDGAPGASGPAPADDNADDNEDTLDIDGDATILVPPAQLPAGTAQLHGGSDQKKG